MNKIIEVILYSVLLIGCSSQNWGWLNGQPCNYSCDSCNGDYREIPSCSCIVKYYDNGTANCQPCQYSCSTCSSSTSCISCNSASNRLFESGNPYCACKTRYYDPGSQQCLACDPTCLSCQRVSSNCTSCNGIAQRTLSSNSCVCMTSYFDTSTSIQQCAACLYSCYTCVSSPSNCTTCSSNLNRGIVTSTCPCIALYFQNSSLLCQLCSYQCATCSFDANNCNSCCPNRISSPTCACLAQYYDSGSPSCVRCQYTCSSCSSLTKCDTCNPTYQRLFTQASSFCVCPDRYYDPGVQACAACYSTCFRCSSSSSISCTACNSAAFRALSSGSCSCITGYYATSPTFELCSACFYSCLNCFTTANNCISCNVTLNRILSSTNCPCAPTFFQNSSLLCDTCQSSCATCTNKLTCTSCFTSQQTVIDSTGFCSCVAGKFWNSNICSTCSYFCLTCIGSVSFCTSCPLNSNRVFSNGSCNCLTGYYDNNVATCISCYYSCLTCSNGLNTGCSQCDSSKKRSLSSGKCICSMGYYDDGANATCSGCNYNCLTCTGSNNCLNCNSSLFRSYSLTTGYCQCYSNYYENNFNCYPCISTCLTCTNGLTCSTCDSTLNRFLNITLYSCDCNIGYYGNSSNLCSVCGPLCDTCNNGTACLTCKNNLNRTLNTNTYLCDCLFGYVLILSSNTCQFCQYTCLNCVTNYTNRCAACDNSTNRSLNSTSNQCQCTVGYFDDGVHTVCFLCSYTCQTCSGSSNACLSCSIGSNRVYDSIYLTCYCTQHYYDNNITFGQNSTCLSCLYYCSKCVQSTSCTSCNSTNFRVLDASNSKCSCIRGYYDDSINEKCIVCSYKCQTCTNSSVCLTCNSSWNRDSPNSQCPCSIGYYDSGISICPVCQYSCLTCIIGTKCATCQGLYNRLYNSATKFCSCTAGYYDPGSAICQLCSYSCLTCVTRGSNCLTCNPTAKRTYNSLSFSCPCSNGFYDNAVLLCLSCNYTCSTCGNNRSCLTCNISRFRTMNFKSGLCACITSYYDNNSTETCLPCQATCLICINSINCTSCDPSRNRILNFTANYANLFDHYCPCFYKYYSLSINNSCSSCHFSCSYCSGSSNINCLYCSFNSQRSLQSTGKCTCNNRYYDTNTTELCLSCNIACLKCWNSLSTTCFTCNSTNFMMVGANTCYVNCPTYYFNNMTAMICNLCQIHCLVCLDSTNCTQCESPMFLFNFTCQISCPLGYYPNSTTYRCELCKNGCANCSASNNCFKCVNTSYYVDQATTLCELCSPSCVTCFGPSQSNCLNCTYPLFLNAQYMCMNLSCSYGKYIDTFKGCVQCNILFANSINCNISKAFLCQKSYLLSQGNCLSCSQVAGYALDSYNQCNQMCGDGILIYYQCDDGNTLKGDGCSANCIIEDSWNCITVGKKSVCKLKGQISLSLIQIIKFARLNVIRIALKISIPLQLNSQNFQLSFNNLSSKYYSFNVLPQNQADLTYVNLEISYNIDIQNQKLSLIYTQSRRLQQIPNDASRLLTSVNFSNSFSIQAFPPAKYIDENTYTYYDTVSSIIFYLGIILMILNLIVTPKKYAMHSLTFSWIVPYLYFTLFHSTSYTSEWVSSIASKLKYPSAYWGFSFGQCCYIDANKNTSSEVIDNVGAILLVFLAIWGIFIILSFFKFQIEAQLLLKTYRMFQYFLLTSHLFFFMQLTFAATYAVHNYTLSNKIDAFNITLALFMFIGICFFLASLWYITNISKFDGNYDGMSSKAATRHSIGKQSSSNTENTEQNASDIVINFSNLKELGKLQSNQFDNIASAFTPSSTKINRNGTHSSGFTYQGIAKTEQCYQQQMGQQESFLPFDFCYLYRNSDKRAKYFLPLLTTKNFLFTFFSVTLTDYPFEMMILHLSLSIFFFIYFCSYKPFQSKFTQARITVIQLIIIIIEGEFTVYQFYAKKKQYFQKLEFYIVMTVVILLCLAIIFTLIEQFRIWKKQLKYCCESCCLYFRLKGKSHKIQRKTEKDENIIKVEQVNQSDLGQVDAFYARMLQKQALNHQYKRDRMIPDLQFQKSLA